jgi:hypothetical protein
VEAHGVGKPEEQAREQAQKQYEKQMDLKTVTEELLLTDVGVVFPNRDKNVRPMVVLVESQLVVLVKEHTVLNFESFAEDNELNVSDEMRQNDHVNMHGDGDDGDAVDDVMGGDDGDDDDVVEGRAAMSGPVGLEEGMVDYHAKSEIMSGVVVVAH